MLNPLQGMANIADHFHLRGRDAGSAAKADGAVQSAKERLGVETKYVDVMIQVGSRCLLLLDLVFGLRRWLVHRGIKSPEDGGPGNHRPVLQCEPG